MKHKGFIVSGQVFILLVLLFLLGLVYFQAQHIQDYIRLRGYEPPAEIEQIATDTTLTDYGRKLFYVNHPVIADRASFSQNCSAHGERTIVLGCYHSPDRGIYLFDVTDGRLQGVEQVTAAHEVLHAAYRRLGGAERRQVDAWLQDFSATAAQDPRLKDTLAAYKDSEPDELLNEMHSIFATEVSELPEQLDQYYRQYFQDRKQVVRYAEQYQQEFTSRREKVDAYDSQLKQLKVEMDQNIQRLDLQEAQIEARRQDMERQRSAGDIAAYNASVPVFNEEVERYNDLLEETRSIISRYNALVEERNGLALEVKELAESIDSNLSPIAQ